MKEVPTSKRIAAALLGLALTPVLLVAVVLVAMLIPIIPLVCFIRPDVVKINGESL